jgi:hypothetical protein
MVVNRYAEGDLGEADQEVPVITLRYEPWRIGWRFFFVLGPFFALCFYTAFFQFPRDRDIFKWFFYGVISFGLFGVTLIGIDTILTKEYQVFPDRIIKRFRMIGKIEAPFDSVSVMIASYIFGNALVLSFRRRMPFRQRIRLSAMMFDLNLARKGSMESLGQACKSAGIELL